MQKRIVIKNGKKYIVNTVGWDDGVGAGCPEGTLWMTSVANGLWYAINATGTAGSAAVSINQTTIGWQDNSLGYQLVSADNGNIYAVYLTGIPNSVVFTVSQSAYTGSSGAKPYLLLQSVTDGNYYQFYLKNNSGSIQLSGSNSMISSSWLHPVY